MVSTNLTEQAVVSGVVGLWMTDGEVISRRFGLLGVDLCLLIVIVLGVITIFRLFDGFGSIPEGNKRHYR